MPAEWADSEVDLSFFVLRSSCYSSKIILHTLIFLFYKKLRKMCFDSDNKKIHCSCLICFFPMFLICFVRVVYHVFLFNLSFLGKNIYFIVVTRKKL